MEIGGQLLVQKQKVSNLSTASQLNGQTDNHNESLTEIETIDFTLDFPLGLEVVFPERRDVS